MWHAVVWALVGLVVVAWTLLVGATHALMSALAGSGASAGGWAGALEQWRIPLWLAEWLPMEAITALKTSLTALGPWLETLLGALPGLLGWLVPLLWLGWAIGLLVMLAVGAAGSVLVVALRGKATG